MKRQIKIGDFKFSNLDKEAINQVVLSNRVTEHKQTRDFEKSWAKLIGTKYAIATNSGTSALISGLSALRHLDNFKRKKVITTPLTYIATSNAIKLNGLEPLYADINPKTFDLKTSGIENILKNNDDILAILPVHLMGYPCDMDEINRLAKIYSTYVFEDSAQAHGTKYKGKNVGSLSDLSDFSFYVAHNLSCGELGVLNTNNKQIKNLVRQIKSNGRLCYCDTCKRMENKCPQKNDNYDPRFTHNILGYNFRANEFSTAIANIRLKEMDEINTKRRFNVQYLNDGLKKHKDLQLPIYSEDISYLGYPLVIKKGDRKSLTSELELKGIETRSLFGCIPLQQPSYSYLKKEYEGKLSNAEYIGRNGFYIGCHQYLENEDLDYVVKSFDEVLK